MTDFIALSSTSPRQTTVLTGLHRSACAAVARRKAVRAQRRAETFAMLLDNHTPADLGLGRMIVVSEGS